MRDYQESVTTGQTDTQTDAAQNDPYVPLFRRRNTKYTKAKNPQFYVNKERKILKKQSIM